MRIHKTIICISAVVAACMTGCIKNDIPYPRIQANFLTFSADGQDRGTVIDSITRTVTLHFDESVDIEAVRVDEYSVTPGAEIVGTDLSQPIDLSIPMDVYLRLYQDWQWTIVGQQEIERYFTLSGQVGNSVIDVPGKRIIAYVSKNTSLSNMTVESIKLGPAGSTMSPDLSAPGIKVDFTHPVEVMVTTPYGKSSYWSIYVERSNVSVETVAVDGWTNVGWVYGRAEAGQDNGIEYRIKGDADWTRVDKSEIVVNGGNFHTRLIHLSPLTTYEARAYSGEAYGETLEFTTGSIVQVPNTSLYDWWLDGKVWNPWAEGAEPYWDTGNKGATTLGASNSMPTDDTSSGQGWAAMLETRFVGIGAIGKLAAGNLFVGRYVRTDGSNGVLSFGRPFTQRPTKLRGYLKYTSAPISSVTAGFENLKDRPDTCIVWLALIDQDEPFEIRTNPKNRQLFDPEGSYVVAYGKIEYGETISQYIPFEFELDYRSTSRIPKYILITASASKYGDYFTGGAGSVLYLDDLELLYDY